MFVLFATPSYDHKVHLNYLTSFMNTMVVLSQNKITHALKCEGGITFIDHARNVLVHKFLTEYPEATDLFFLDDDISWPPEAVLRLLNHDVDIVAGVYPLKSDDGGYPVSLLANASTGGLIEKDGLFKADFVPTGFMRMRRNVLEVMAEDQPTYPYRQGDGTVLQIQNVFHTGYHDGERWGEDVDFCHRWIDKGGDIWVDPDIEFSHVGRKRWTGNFSTALEGYRKAAFPKEAA